MSDNNLIVFTYTIKIWRILAMIKIFILKIAYTLLRPPHKGHGKSRICLKNKRHFLEQFSDISLTMTEKTTLIKGSLLIFHEKNPNIDWKMLTFSNSSNQKMRIKTLRKKWVVETVFTTFLVLTNFPIFVEKIEIHCVIWEKLHSFTL